MRYKGIILTGTGGAGKTTLARLLCSRDPRFVHMPAVTTRAQRADDLAGDFTFLTDDQFNVLETGDHLLVQSEYRGYKYGIRVDDLDVARKKGKVPVLTLPPEAAVGLSSVRNGGSGSSLFHPPKYMTVFLDAPDSALNTRLTNRNEVDLKDVDAQRARDRATADECLYRLGNQSKEDSVELLLALWDSSDTGGVLPARLIDLMLRCGMLLDQADRGNVSGASYDLALGDSYFHKGRVQQLSDGNPTLLIEPYDYAIVTSHEVANLPKDVCGRFDLSVGQFTSGMILSNGPQVDPGFKGPLLCLLLNASDAPMLLKRRQHYATLEFHKLVEPTYAYSGRYQGKDILHYIEGRPTQGALRAISNLRDELAQLKRELKDLSTKVDKLSARVLAWIAVGLTALGIGVAVLMGLLAYVFRP